MTARIPLIAKPEWTSEEEQRLGTLLTCGVHPAAIGEQLNRSEGAIRHRMTKLGLRPKRGKRPTLAPSERMQALKDSASGVRMGGRRRVNERPHPSEADDCC